MTQREREDAREQTLDACLIFHVLQEQLKILGSLIGIKDHASMIDDIEVLVSGGAIEEGTKRMERFDCIIDQWAEWAKEDKENESA